MVRDIVHYWSQIVFIVSCISLLCVYNSIIDLFREGYQGLKSEVWQLIHRWSSGSVVWLMIIGLGFDSPHILIWKKIINFDKFSKWNIKISKKNSKSKKGYGKNIASGVPIQLSGDALYMSSTLIKVMLFIQWHPISLYWGGHWVTWTLNFFTPVPICTPRSRGPS